MATLFGSFPFLLKCYAKAGYQGPEFRKAVEKVVAAANVEIVKRSDQAKGFVVLPRRWVVERTFTWLGRCRRLVKDWDACHAKRSPSCASLPFFPRYENSVMRDSALADLGTGSKRPARLPPALSFARSAGLFRLHCNSEYIQRPGGVVC